MIIYSHIKGEITDAWKNFIDMSLQIQRPPEEFIREQPLHPRNKTPNLF